MTWECHLSLSWSNYWCLCIWGWGSSGCCRFTVTIQMWHLKVTKATVCGPGAITKVSSCYNCPVWCRISILHKFTNRKRNPCAFLCMSVCALNSLSDTVSSSPQPKKCLFYLTLTDDTFYICFKLAKFFGCIISFLFSFFLSFFSPVDRLQLSCLAKHRTEMVSLHSGLKRVTSQSHFQYWL